MPMLHLAGVRRAKSAAHAAASRYEFWPGCPIITRLGDAATPAQKKLARHLRQPFPIELEEKQHRTRRHQRYRPNQIDVEPGASQDLHAEPFVDEGGDH